MQFKRLLFLTIFSIFATNIANAQLARVQIIHNSPDIAYQGIDIYINGVLKVDDLFFRNASMFFDVDPSVPFEIGVARDISFSIIDTFYSTTTTLSNSGIYIVVLNGIESPSGYSPAPPFTASIFNMGRESATQPANTDILFMHGGTDVAAMDIKTGITTLANDLSYGSFSNGYSQIITNDIKIRRTNTLGNVINASYDAALNGYGLNNQAGVVCVSGFANPAMNSNGPAMGLWIAPATGGPMFEFTPTTNNPFARVQLIHNSADTTTDTIDVYYNGEKILDDFMYLHATPYIDAYANVPSQIAIAKYNSTSIADTFFSTNITFDSAKTYVVVANGIESDTNYKPLVPFSLHTYNTAKEEGGTSTTTEMIFINGSTDAPTIDITQGTNTIFNNINYGFFNNTGYQSINIQNVLLDIADAGGQSIKRFTADFPSMGIQNQTAVLLSTGFMEPDSNSSGPALGLHIARSNGGQLIALPVATINVKTVNNINSNILLWPNPSNGDVYFDNVQNYHTASIYDITGKLVQFTLLSNNHINVAQLPTGSYIIQLSNGKEKGIARFTKQ